MVESPTRKSVIACVSATVAVFEFASAATDFRLAQPEAANISVNASAAA